MNAAVGAGAGGLGRHLARNRMAAKVLNYLSGTVFLGLAVRLGFMSRV